MRERVALCLTVLNEADNLDALFASAAGQTRRPDEIVVVDGGSSDGTPDVIQRWQACGLPIVFLARPGANISTGRNAAIAHSTAPIVAVTDAGVRLVPGWLAALLAPFGASNPPDVVAGWFESDPRSAWETALGATTLPDLADIDTATFLPSSRSAAFRRDAWARVGGYPEWLDYCEDLVFDIALRDAGCRFAFAAEAVARFRPRSSPQAFFQQYYRYARGDGKADLWRKRHAIRYATYLGLPLGVLAARHRPWLVLPLVLAAAAYMRRPYQRLRPTLTNLSPRDRWAAIAWVPLVRAIGDVAKMAGYPVGVWWRLRQTPPPGTEP
ncbi:MAG: glycosyltransferase [Chloroflexi bacterium]|nr:glycosyltransferase [Chloroflexota bacterium]